MKPSRVGRKHWQVIIVLLSCFWAAQIFAQQGDQNDPPARVARISFVSGKVSLKPAGVDQWSEAALNYPMTTNDQIYTDQGTRAELDTGGSAVRVSEATDLTVANLNDQFMQLGLAQGTIRVSVYQLPAGNSVEVDTPNGALTLLRSGYYRVDSFPNDNTTLVSVYSGSVQLSGANLSGAVQGGQAVKLTGSGPIQEEYVSLPAQDNFDQWSAERDRRFISAVSARYVGRDMPGYYDLDGYGVWSEAPQYGPVWYPSAVPVGWVPYRYGHWVWVGPWGWTWVDQEPWGFAPFHYGRWAYLGGRWGWLPGPVVARPYYAPALVAFVGGPHFSLGVRVGGGIGVAAWFPLGPGEPYYPWYHCGNGYLRQVNVTNIRHVTNITNIVNVRNVSNIRYVNERVATTAVRSTVFSRGEAVRNGMVRVNAQEIARAQVIPHPMVNPAEGAALGGRAVPRPAVRAERFTAAPRTFSKQARPATTANRTYPEPRPQSARTYPAPLRQGVRNPPVRNSFNGPPATRARLFTNRTPAPRSVPFQTKERAMAAHPGRPLEPRQVNNLRQGRPAGPMRDREYIPHPQPSGGRQQQGHASHQSHQSHSAHDSHGKRH